MKVNLLTKIITKYLLVFMTPLLVFIEMAEKNALISLQNKSDVIQVETNINKLNFLSNIIKQEYNLFKSTRSSVFNILCSAR